MPDEDDLPKLMIIGVIAIVALLIIASIVNSLINWWNSAINVPGFGNLTNGSFITLVVLLAILLIIYLFLDKNR